MEGNANFQPATCDLHRLRVEIHGAVQGVGFRPFVYRLATDLGLQGWVINDTQGVFVEVEGPDSALARFLERLPDETPARAIIQSLSSAWLPPVGYERFEIRHSNGSGAKPPSSCLMWPPAPIVWPSCWPRTTGAITTRSLTALTAGRGSALLRHCPTTGRTQRCAGSLCARPVRPSTTARSTGDSTRSRTPARSAVPGWRCHDEGRTPLVAPLHRLPPLLRLARTTKPLSPRRGTAACRQNSGG